MAVGNAVVHFEIGAAQDAPLVAFYGELFGWGLNGSPGGGYTLIDTRGGRGINGGIGKSQSGEPWSTFYVEVDDLQATLDRASSLGGATVMPVTELGAGMTVAMFSDPDGLLVGLVRAAAEPADEDSSAPSAGPGNPIDWFEVMGSDAARTQRFYTGLFDWKLDDAGFPDYASADTGTGRGIQGGLGGGQESRWATIYALVADLDETLSRAEKLGGSRVTDPSVPALKSAGRIARYGVDDGMRTGAFRDPAGNVLGIYQRRRRKP
jgi:predicted enzyme related to lactoylglutathione lyase